MVQFLAGEMLSPLLLLGGMLAVMYFFMIRPENKRKKEAEAMRNALKNGDKITTIGGIVGTIVDVKEDRFVIETSADRVRVEVMKWALSTNDSAVERQKEAQKKAAEEKAKLAAAKKAKKKDN